MLYLIIVLPVVNAFSENQKFLVDTQGCKIPDYYLKIPETLSRYSCGYRKVFANKINQDKISFTITEDLEDCCYKFIKTKHYTDFYPPHGVEFTECKKLKHGQTVELKSDFVSVECKNYSDIYGFVKKVSTKKQKPEQEHHWNVILIGLDRTSRARAYSSLPRTTQFLKDNDWFDFRGYNKVAANTYPNLVALLAGVNESEFENACRLGMSACNHLMIWSKYKKEGYVTAYGEDSVYYPDTFNRRKGHATPPTDHFMRPLFKAGERKTKNVICCKRITSGEHILNYVVDFVNTYRYEKFFGFFWISSFSHAYLHYLPHYDELLESFFKALEEMQLQNTFIIFLSDHGLRYGKQKNYVESFYEDKLPMLFIKPPLNFDVAYPYTHTNLNINQHRLLSPKDLHLTLLNMMTRKNYNNNDPKSEECPYCQSILRKLPQERDCSDAGIPDYFCACRDLKPISVEDHGTVFSLIKLIGRIQNITKEIRTRRCTYCQILKLKYIIRLHYFKQNNVTFYIIAFTTTPGKKAFEGMVTKMPTRTGNQYEVLPRINVIHKYSEEGNCARHGNDRLFCYCRKYNGCNAATRGPVIIYQTIASAADQKAKRRFYSPDEQHLAKLQPLRRKPKKEKYGPLLYFDDVDEPARTIKYNIADSPMRYLREHFPLYVFGPLQL